MTIAAEDIAAPAPEVKVTPERPTTRPGFNVPLNEYRDTDYSSVTDGNKRFPSAVMDEEWFSNTPTVRERAMLSVMNMVTDKPEWSRKVFDDTIVAKWKSEIATFPYEQPFHLGFTDRMFDWCIQELRAKAPVFDKTGIVSVFDLAAAVFKSDSIVPAEVRAALLEGVKPLEDVPEKDKDWHPGSDNLVLDLVHPSLWPVVYGKTRAVKEELTLANCLDAYGQGKVLVEQKAWEKKKAKTNPVSDEAPQAEDAETSALFNRLVGLPEDDDGGIDNDDEASVDSWMVECGLVNDSIIGPSFGDDEPLSSRILSRKFQWLPCEVKLDDAGKTKITSYINNLHPVGHAALYPVVEKLLDASMPMLDAAYERVMSWEGRDAVDPLSRTRVPCLESNRDCGMPDWCKAKGNCASYNGPYDSDDGGDDDDDDDDDDDEEDNDGDDGGDGDDGDDGDDDEDDDEEEEDDGENDDHDDDDDNDEKVEDGTKDETEAEATVGEDSTGTAVEEIVVLDPALLDPELHNPELEARFPDDPELEAYERNDLWYNRTHPITQPEPRDTFECIGVTEYKTSGYFGGRRELQVIVKLANIHLTPEKPEYNGGSWHVEGAINERICATALYYYDQDNITPSSLGFRTNCDSEEMCMNFEYEQSDHVPFEAIYGMVASFANDSGTIAHFGEVQTSDNRMLVFPNVFQHRVSPFKLRDATKPGHRKIVALFLVDPATPVLSTANVPPQQQHWGNVPEVDERLPAEISRMVYEHIDCPYPLETAKKIREELMEERKSVAEASNKIITMGDFSLCEH